MLNDTDFGFYRSDELWGHYQQPLNHEHNTIKIVMNEFDGRLGSETWPNFLFRELMRNQEFKNRFLGRFNDIANGYLNEQAANKKLDEKVALLNKEIDYHLEQWGSIPSKEIWQSYIERKKLFAKERPSIIREFMMEEFEIEGTISVTVSNETESGYVRLNKMEIREDLPGNEKNSLWSGTYFKMVPISIEAIAKEGYQFSHWEDSDSKNSFLELVPVDDVELKAVFIKE
ncbi:CotH kinase family protein [Jeotgalibaca sp. MA1X17-3]|nr:CotH kinase family protein [Jeotgalibaca sp. MA1X17-3]